MRIYIKSKVDILREIIIMKKVLSFLFLLFSIEGVSWGSFCEEGFFHLGDKAKPVHHAGAMILKQYPHNAPDGFGSQLCLIVAYDKNLAHWTIPAGGVDAALDYKVQGDKKLFSPLLTIRREVLEEMAGALYFREEYLHQCPQLYSPRFKDLLVVTKDNNLSCSALSLQTHRFADNVDLSSCWRETKGVDVIPISEVLTVAAIMKTHFDVGGHIKNLPPAVVSPNVSKHFKNPLVYLKTRLGKKIEFCAYYMGAMADALDNLRNVLKQNDRGVIFHEAHNQIFQDDHKPEPEIRFDPAAYVALHEDVRTYFAKGNPTLKNVLDRATAHYEGAGKRERRTYRFSALQEPLKMDPTTNINSLVYLALNPDLQGHFATHSFQQALKAAEAHYKNNGINEARNLYVMRDHQDSAKEVRALTLPKDFDSELYLVQNPEVKAYAQKKGYDVIWYAALHCRTRGKDIDFKPFMPDNYLMLNQDLKSYVADLSQESKRNFLKNHYLQYGAKEGRLYGVPQGFNPAQYLTMNPDVRDHIAAFGESLEKSLSRATRHYARYGRSEGRAFISSMPKRQVDAQTVGTPEGFDPLVYLALHDDVRLAFKSKPWVEALEMARVHMLAQGKIENRCY